MIITCIENTYLISIRNTSTPRINLDPKDTIFERRLFHQAPTICTVHVNRCTFMAQSQPKMMDHLQQPFAGGSTNIILSLQINKYIYIYILYIHTYIHIYIFIYLFIYTHKNAKKNTASSRVQICFFHCPSGVFFPRKAAAIESWKVLMPVFLDLKCQWLCAFFWPNEIVFHQPRFSLK